MVTSVEQELQEMAAEEEVEPDESEFPLNKIDFSSESHGYELPKSWTEIGADRFTDFDVNPGVMGRICEKAAEGLFTGILATSGYELLGGGPIAVEYGILFGTAAGVYAYRGRQLYSFIAEDHLSGESLEKSGEELIANSEEVKVSPGPGAISSDSLAEIYTEALEEWYEAELEISQELRFKGESEYELSVICEGELQFKFKGKNENLEEYRD
jgi:hypothetical protein